MVIYIYVYISAVAVSPWVETNHMLAATVKPLKASREVGAMNVQIQVLHSSEFDGATWYAIRVRENQQEWLVQRRFSQFADLDIQLASCTSISRLPLPKKFGLKGEGRENVGKLKLGAGSLTMNRGRARSACERL